METNLPRWHPCQWLFAAICAKAVTKFSKKTSPPLAFSSQLIGLTIVASLLPVATQTSAPVANDGTAVATADITAGILTYARWPEPLRTVRLCIVGPSPSSARIANRTLVNGQILSTARISVGEWAPERCDAVFLGRTTMTERTSIIRSLANRPILSMTDSDPQCIYGSMFCLRSVTGGVTFDLNIDAVSRSRVRVDPRVLALARRPGGAR